MNDPQNPAPSDPAKPPPQVPGAPENMVLSGQAENRNKGKVARLPKAVRDDLNQMLDDGLTYAQIISALGPFGKGLSEKNVSNWRGGGHQAWVAEQQRLDRMRVRQEFAIDLVRVKAGATTQQAAYEIAALNLCDLIDDFEPSLLKEALHSDVKTYAMLLSAFTKLLLAMPKLSQADAECETRLAEAAELLAKARSENDGKAPGLSDQARQEMENKLHLM